MTEPEFDGYMPAETGRINDKDLLRRIYDKILLSKRISKIIKRDIHTSFNKIAMGLKMPK